MTLWAHPCMHVRPLPRDYADLCLHCGHNNYHHMHNHNNHDTNLHCGHNYHSIVVMHVTALVTASYRNRTHSQGIYADLCCGYGQIILHCGHHSSQIPF